jgi:hypothetical protein
MYRKCVKCGGRGISELESDDGYNPFTGRRKQVGSCCRLLRHSDCDGPDSSLHPAAIGKSTWNQEEEGSLK